MHAPVFIYDPTQLDELSRVRGIGRYMQIWRENAPSNWIFTTSLSSIPSHSFFIQPFFTFFQKPLISRRVADRQIAVIHDLIPQKYPQQFPAGLRATLFEAWSRWILKNHIDHIITDSQASKEDILKILAIPEHKVSVVYPTLARSFWQSSEIAVNFQPGNYCIYVGDGTWNKNLPNIARAIQKADVTCMFVGKIFEEVDPQSYRDPWQKDLREFFQIAQFDKRFIFAGYVSDQQLSTLYQKARLNLLISRDEGFGFSYVEAGAFRCPSILADRPIFHEIAGKAALFCDPEDPDSIATMISSLFSDEKKRNVMGEHAFSQSYTYSQAQFQKNLTSTVYQSGYGIKM